MSGVCSVTLTATFGASQQFPAGMSKADRQLLAQPGRLLLFAESPEPNQKADDRLARRKSLEPTLCTRASHGAYPVLTFLELSEGLTGQTLDFIGVPDRIRTCDPQIRNLVLYPAELRGHLRH